MRSSKRVLLLCAFWLLVPLGCQHGLGRTTGLQLPQGDVDSGAIAFQELGCGTCHDVAGLIRPTGGAWPEVIVTLGGQVAVIPTQDELATHIVNPSHTLTDRYAKEDVSEGGGSRMRDFNQIMTVAQLADLAAFLHSKYELLEEPPW